MKRSSHRPLHALVLALALLLPGVASAQWVTESYELKDGWNGIWLSQDCSAQGNGETRSIDDVLAGYPQILEVWRWNPLGSTVQFTQAPSAPIASDTSWAVWRRGDPDNSTLGTLTGNSAYLIRVATGTATFMLPLTGKPLVPSYSFSSTGLNFLGFPTAAPAPKVEDFFSFSSVLQNNPDVYFYKGGPLSDINPKNPLKLTTPRFAPVSRGKAYWVKSDVYADYYGPLQVTVLGYGGIEFGRKLNTVTVRVKNVTDPLKNQNVTATFSLVGPGVGPGETLPAPTVPIRVRGPRDANLQFTYSDLPSTLIDLAPGEQRDLIFDANRTQMDIPDQSYEAIIQVTDSLGQTRIDLPVSAIGSSPNGVWVGAAVLDSVNRVETISGPETDAPVGTPNGAGPEATSVVTTTDTTTAGQTASVVTFNAAFDAEDNAYLDATGLTGANLIVTGPSGTPVYAEGSDYTISPSMRATVTNGGSGYKRAPSVTFTGGGGTGAVATATLSAGVRSVWVSGGGSGYTSAPVVTFTGGGGSGATGFALIDTDTGIVTDVSMTNGGSGYTAEPNVVFAGGGGTGAAASAEIVGSVGSVTITAGGSGYTAAPALTIVAEDLYESGDAEGSGAEATVQMNGGIVTGVDVLHKVSGGTIGASVRITVSTQSAAPAGTRDGTITSTVTSTSKLVTLNGKSHTVTRRISTGGGAAAPSNFPIRLILHAPASGSPTLLQQVYLGTRDGVSYAGPEEASIDSLVTGTLFDVDGNAVPAGKVGRVSSASFPRGEFWTAASGSFPDTASFTVGLGYDAPTNPFLHTYHPDHDNWDARYESKLPAGVESYTVSRAITLNFSPALPAGVSDLTWGVTTLGGTYSEVITGLRSESIEVSGRFILHQVSEVPTLTQP